MRWRIPLTTPKAAAWKARRRNCLRRNWESRFKLRSYLDRPICRRVLLAVQVRIKKKYLELWKFMRVAVSRIEITRTRSADSRRLRRSVFAFRGFEFAPADPRLPPWFLFRRFLLEFQSCWFVVLFDPCRSAWICPKMGGVFCIFVLLKQISVFLPYVLC